MRSFHTTHYSSTGEIIDVDMGGAFTYYTDQPAYINGKVSSIGGTSFTYYTDHVAYINGKLASGNNVSNKGISFILKGGDRFDTTVSPTEIVVRTFSSSQYRNCK